MASTAPAANGTGAPPTFAAPPGSTSRPSASSAPANAAAAAAVNMLPPLSMAEEKKYRKKYAELRKLVRDMEAENDTLYLRLEGVKRHLARLKAEKRILLEFLEKAFEEREERTKPVPPLNQDGVKVLALPMTTDVLHLDRVLDALADPATALAAATAALPTAPGASHAVRSRAVAIGVPPPPKRPKVRDSRSGRFTTTKTPAGATGGIGGGGEAVIPLPAAPGAETGSGVGGVKETTTIAQHVPLPAVPMPGRPAAVPAVAASRVDDAVTRPPPPPRGPAVASTIAPTTATPRDASPANSALHSRQPSDMAAAPTVPAPALPRSSSLAALLYTGSSPTASSGSSSASSSSASASPSPEPMPGHAVEQQPHHHHPPQHPHPHAHAHAHPPHHHHPQPHPPPPPEWSTRPLPHPSPSSYGAPPAPLQPAFTRAPPTGTTAPRPHYHLHGYHTAHHRYTDPVDMEIDVEDGDDLPTPASSKSTSSTSLARYASAASAGTSAAPAASAGFELPSPRFAASTGPSGGNYALHSPPDRYPPTGAYPPPGASYHHHRAAYAPPPPMHRYTPAPPQAGGPPPGTGTYGSYPYHHHAPPPPQQHHAPHPMHHHHHHPAYHGGAGGLGSPPMGYGSGGGQGQQGAGGYYGSGGEQQDAAQQGGQGQQSGPGTPGGGGGGSLE
ncbi:hypothetical protein AMAG_19004 [Allomyces macrogynus ATCC 38327]|uniref:INO80 complex subunit F domain-containing protein n=1 Tax=Allomyces macrogynus (strain ATCC 38327) TaxID=578462 RepID=A0A0L0SM56_ALLM3|nr:hypothetical protein AMAG_19004 [Allomyces macrogynus ATCC 38327]|eukprot:KNE63459.1 hypothetical protein AMAG_19004 [Allomyces macrogynus ATCC 38327]